MEDSVMTSRKARPVNLFGRTEEIHKELEAIQWVFGFESGTLRIRIRNANDSISWSFHYYLSFIYKDSPSGVQVRV